MLSEIFLFVAFYTKSKLFFLGFQVYLYGGHVTSWKNDHGEELLFVSSKVIFIFY